MVYFMRLYDAGRGDTSMTLQNRKRIPWIDIAKCIAIFLVVLGHTLRGGVIQKIIYSFQVTAFFWLSGMTCKVKDIKTQIKNDFLRIMIPYYCFGIISMLIFAFLGSFAADHLELSVDTSLKDSIFELLLASSQGDRLKFNLPLWFLPCLFTTKIIYYAIYKLVRGNQKTVLLSGVILAALGFLYTYLQGPVLPFNLSISLKMFVFFSLGRSFFLWSQNNEYRLSNRVKNIAIGVILLMITALIAIFAPKINYARDRFPSVLGFLLTSLTGSLGICFVSMGIKSKWMEYVGKATLAVLVMHKFPVLLFQTVGPQKTLLTQYDSVLCVIIAVLIAIVSIALCLVCERIILRFFPFLLGDFSFISKKKNRQ